MKKLLKYLLGIIVVVLILLGFYIYRLHVLAVDGNKIFALRCVKVNPPLIKYKVAFLKWADWLNSPNPYEYSKDEVRGYLDEYITGMKEYVPAETAWLETQQKYINRWDFKIFMPMYMKKAADYQWKMYEAYRDDAKYILETYDTGASEEDINSVRHKEAVEKQKEARYRRDDYNQKYFEFYKEASELRDWRKIFQIIPLPEECNEENMTIPDTSGSIDWEEKSATPSPKLIPIDPRTTG